MSGTALRTARQAAATYVRTLPPDVRVGLVTFGGTAQHVVAPDANRASVISALASLTPSGATHLYDGVAEAAQAAGGSGVRRVVLLAASTDSASTRNVLQARNTVTSAGVVVGAIAVPSAPLADVTAFTQASTPVGSVPQVTDVSGLSSAFGAEAATLQHVVTIEAPIPHQLVGQAGNLLVRGQGPAGAVLGRTAWTFPAVGAVTTPRAPPRLRRQRSRRRGVALPPVPQAPSSAAPQPIPRAGRSSPRRW